MTKKLLHNTKNTIREKAHTYFLHHPCQCRHVDGHRPLLVLDCATLIYAPPPKIFLKGK